MAVIFAHWDPQNYTRTSTTEAQAKCFCNGEGHLIVQCLDDEGEDGCRGLGFRYLSSYSAQDVRKGEHIMTYTNISVYSTGYNRSILQTHASVAEARAKSMARAI